MYVTGALLVLFVAVGLGATAAVVVGWQSRGMLEGSKTETSSTARASEDTAIEPSSDSKNSKDTEYKASFVHRATEKNSRGDYTYISDPSINGHPNAIVLVSHKKDLGSAPYEHYIGVWYAAAADKWAIFNQDRTAVQAGATFRVEVPQASASFVHQADLLNTAGNYTYLDDPLTNGEPDAVLTVTQNWNPGGGGGVYNNHPIGTVYDAKLEKWAIYNQDGKSMPKGAAFNIAVLAGANEPAR